MKQELGNSAPEVETLQLIFSLGSLPLFWPGRLTVQPVGAGLENGFPLFLIREDIVMNLESLVGLPLA